jgi:hypothetical protein
MSLPILPCRRTQLSADDVKRFIRGKSLLGWKDSLEGLTDKTTEQFSGSYAEEGTSYGEGAA